VPPDFRATAKEVKSVFRGEIGHEEVEGICAESTSSATLAFISGAVGLAGWRSEARRLRELEGENTKLKKLLAEAMLDIEALKVVARGKR
jgi:4-hydroxy-3-methylbut-2-enyl diphosphate reductase IspH